MSETKEPKRTGRPSSYTEELGDRICELLAEGVSLRQITLMDGMPTWGTVMDWAFEGGRGAHHPSFSIKFARAKRIGTHAMAEEVREISDDARYDTKLVGRDGDIEVADAEWIARSKLRVETRFRLMGMWNKVDYGDKKHVELTGAGGGPIKTITGDMSPAEAAGAYAASLRGAEGEG
jgi:hypothetical protein